MEISLFADNCRGQDKNRFIVEMLPLVLLQFQNSQFYGMELFILERGHTHNENDSKHSAIEQNKNGVSIYHPSQWIH